MRIRIRVVLAVGATAPTSVIGFALGPAAAFWSNRFPRTYIRPSSTVATTTGRLCAAAGTTILGPSNETQVIPDDVVSKSAPTVKKKRAAKKVSEPTAPIHWINATDPFHYQTEAPNNEEGSSATSITSPHRIEFTVRGQPLALKRHRSSLGGFLYNPSAKQQQSFSDAVEGLFYNVTAPLFPLDDYLAITMVFTLQRPKKHYVGNKVAPERLRPSAPLYVKTLPDVDNLAKFVLDSMNDFLFYDDRQVASLQATKIYGDIPSTRVIVQKLSPDGFEELPSAIDGMD